MRHHDWTLGAIASLVVAFLFFMPPPAYAQEANSDTHAFNSADDSSVDLYKHGYRQRDNHLALDPPPDGDEDVPVVAYDNRRVQINGGSRIGLIYAEGVIGGGAVDTLNSGREFGSVSWFGYGQGSVRLAQVNFNRYIALQMGPRVFLEGAAFESRTYRGRKMRVGGGLELSLLDIGHNDRPLWSVTLRPGIAFDHETGYSRTSTYELDFQDSTLFDLEAFAEFYGAFQQTGEYKAYDQTQVIRTGWLHAIQFRMRTSVQLHAARHESFTGRDTDNSRYEFQLIPYIYKGTWLQGEWAVAPVFGVAFHHAAGYKTVSHDNIVTTMSLGATLRLQVLRKAYVHLNGGVHYEERTGRLQGSLGLNFTALEW